MTSTTAHEQSAQQSPKHNDHHATGVRKRQCVAGRICLHTHSSVECGPPLPFDSDTARAHLSPPCSVFVFFVWGPRQYAMLRLNCQQQLLGHSQSHTPHPWEQIATSERELLLSSCEDVSTGAQVSKVDIRIRRSLHLVVSVKPPFGS
eukprot:4991565-Amphidinium_carterae.1